MKLKHHILRVLLIHMISCIQFVSSSAAGGATGHHNSGSSLCKCFFTTNGKICPSSCNGKKVKRGGEERLLSLNNFWKENPDFTTATCKIFFFLFGSFFSILCLREKGMEFRNLQRPLQISPKTSKLSIWGHLRSLCPWFRRCLS